MPTPRAALPPTWTLVAAALLAALCGCAEPEEGAARELTQVTGFGSNPGNLLMYTFAPPSVPARAPLVVVLHGCTQSAADVEAAGWSAAAAAYGFRVVYPQQQAANNRNGCFNWFEPGDTTRGQGESLSIRQMVEHLRASGAVDPARVFVVGFSAGGFMAAAMLAAYPEVFAAGALYAGGPYGCAASLGEATACMNGDVSRPAGDWAEAVRRAAPGYAGPRPRVSLWHGRADATVSVANLTEAMQQWRSVHGLDGTTSAVGSNERYTHTSYPGDGAPALVETWELHGLGHAIAVDPQHSLPGSDAACGSAGGFFVDTGLCTTYLQARFFGLTGASAP